MIPRTAIKAKERESNIHDNLYLVSLIKPIATEAAIICSIIDSIRAISLTMD
jgi:hypothetical protein